MDADDYAAYIALQDQGRAGAADMGRLIAAFWQALVDEGVSPDGAAIIAASYTSATFVNRRER